MKNRSIILCALVAALAAAPLWAAPELPVGTLVKTDGGRVTGRLRWKNAAKEYEVTLEKGSTIVPGTDVDTVEIPRPASLDAAIKGVQAGGGQIAKATAALEDIVKSYNHLTWDREAARWLAEGHIRQGNPGKAISVCEAIIRDAPEAAYMGNMAVAYWRALTKDGKSAKLTPLLEKAIASGDKDSAAAALVARGNAIMERGSARVNSEEALRDGYLRVILLYADPDGEAYPEALYMGAKAFDGMSQGARANKLREKLKSECRNSEWARK